MAIASIERFEKERGPGFALLYPGQTDDGGKRGESVVNLWNQEFVIVN